MKLRKFLAAATALTLLLGAAATPEVGSEIKLALTAHAESGEIPIDEAHFPDKTFREYVKKFDTDASGSFSAEEIAAVDIISADTVTGGPGDISSLNGIEYFSELKYLYCDGNQLATIDVSNNTALIALDCSSNQLTSLDVNKNTALISLTCDSNQLTSLNVSGCTALEDLECNENQLPELDVSKNTALTYVICYSNQLTELDVNKNTMLEYLRCDDNAITSLDVSNNTMLEYLRCDDNAITSLDVSNNTVLEYLRCDDNALASLDVSNNTVLTELDCSGNQLTSLDVKNNTALEDLQCNRNQIASLDVSNNTKLKNMGCSQNAMSSVVVSKNIDLEELNCSFNKLTDLDVSNNTKLKDLDCAGSRIVELDIRNNELLSLALKDIDDLKYGMGFMNSWFYVYNYTIEGSSSSYYDREDYGLCVDTSTIVITKDDQYNVSNGVAISPENFPDWAFRGSVTQQDINNDYILSDDEIAATTSLDIDYSLKDDLYSLKGIEYFTALTRFTCFGGHLTEIDVSNNKALETLWCGENQLTELDVSQNTALTYLDCGYNQLTELDVSKNTALTELNCGGNQLTTLDVSNNTKLNGLFCGNCELTTLDISKNTNITMLYCGGNLFTSLDVSKNTALEELSCTDSLLTTLDVSSNSALSVLYCQNSKLTSLELNKEIVRLLCDHNALKMLDISYCPTLLRACDREEISEKDGVVGYGMYLVIDKTTKLITDPNYVPEEVEIGTADVTGLENIPDVDITDLGITFENESGETYTAEVQSDGTIMLPSLPAGEYTVTASLENCPSRDYEVTVEEGKPVELDVELKLYGDLNGDGILTVFDVMPVNKCAQKTDTLAGYDFKVADVTNDNNINVFDCMKINAHIKKTTLMW